MSDGNGVAWPHGSTIGAPPVEEKVRIARGWLRVFELAAWCRGRDAGEPLMRVVDAST